MGKTKVWIPETLVLTYFQKAIPVFCNNLLITSKVSQVDSSGLQAQIKTLLLMTKFLGMFIHVLSEDFSQCYGAGHSVMTMALTMTLYCSVTSPFSVTITEPSVGTVGWWQKHGYQQTKDVKTWNHGISE